MVQRPEEELLVAAEVMAKRRIKRLPVVEHGRLVGLVSFSDISRVMQEQAESFSSTWVFITKLIKAQAVYQGTRPYSKEPNPKQAQAEAEIPPDPT